jgi:signal transduction histidine kinase
MPGSVANRLLHDAVGVQLPLYVEEARREDRGVKAHVDRDAGRRREIDDRRTQPDLMDPRRSKLRSDLAGLVERRDGELASMADRSRGGDRPGPSAFRVPEAFLDVVEGQDHRGERLANAIVEVPGETGALILLGGRQPCARELSVAALDETREVAAQLRPPRIHEIGLGAAIVDLAASAGIAVDVSFDPAILPPGLLDVQRELDAYRIVQEAIGNAARHAGASVVTVDAALDGGELTLSVTDDGRGFVRDATPVGLGLAGMHERAAILLGKLDVRSVPGEGTTVELKIPIRSSEDPGALATPATQPAEVRA